MGKAMKTEKGRRAIGAVKITVIRCMPCDGNNFGDVFCRKKYFKSRISDEVSG